MSKYKPLPKRAEAMKRQKQLVVISTVVFIFLSTGWPASGQYGDQPWGDTPIPLSERGSPDAKEFIVDDAPPNSSDNKANYIISGLDGEYSDRTIFIPKNSKETAKAKTDIRNRLKLLSEIHLYLPKKDDMPSERTGSNNREIVYPIERAVQRFGILAIPELIEYLDSEAYLYRERIFGRSLKRKMKMTKRNEPASCAGYGFICGSFYCLPI